MKAVYYTNGDIKVIKIDDEYPSANYGKSYPPHLEEGEIDHIETWGRNLDVHTIILNNGIRFTLNEENFQKAKRHFVK